MGPWFVRAHSNSDSSVQWNLVNHGHGNIDLPAVARKDWWLSRFCLCKCCCGRGLCCGFYTEILYSFMTSTDTDRERENVGERSLSLSGAGLEESSFLGPAVRRETTVENANIHSFWENNYSALLLLYYTVLGLPPSPQHSGWVRTSKLVGTVI